MVRKSGDLCLGLMKVSGSCLDKEEMEVKKINLSKNKGRGVEQANGKDP